MLNFKPFCLSKISFLETQRRICWCECEKHTNTPMFSFKATRVIIPRMYMCHCFSCTSGSLSHQESLCCSTSGFMNHCGCKKSIYFHRCSFFLPSFLAALNFFKMGHFPYIHWCKNGPVFSRCVWKHFFCSQQEAWAKRPPWLHTHERSPAEELQQMDFQCH